MYLIKASWEITRKCGPSTKGCSHCYLGNPLSKDSLEENDYLRIAEKLTDSGLQYISITGGEPLLNKSLESLVNYFRSKDVGVNLNTNGFYLDDKIINFLNEKNVLVSLSFHAVTKDCFENTYNLGYPNFRKIESAVKKLNNYSLNTTLTRLNVGDLDNMLEFVKRTGSVWNVTKLINVGRGARPDLYLDVTERKKVEYKLKHQALDLGLEINTELGDDKNCSLNQGHCNIFITPEGKIRPCYALVNHESEKSLQDSSIDDIVSEDSFKVWDKCKECKTDCGPKCKAELLEDKILADFCVKLNPELITSKTIKINQNLKFHLLENEKKIGIYNKNTNQGYKLPEKLRSIFGYNNRTVNELLLDYNIIAKTDVHRFIELIYDLNNKGLIYLEE